MDEALIRKIAAEEARRVSDDLNGRLLGSRHENADHLDRGLLAKKIKPSTVDLQYLRTVSGDAVWDDPDTIVSKAGSFTCPGSTGNYSVTGLGFSPAVVFFDLGYQAAGYAIIGSGAMDSNGTQWARAANTHLASAAAYTAKSSTLCALIITAAGATAMAAAYVSMDADGFTINFTTTDTNANVGWVAVSQPISAAAYQPLDSDLTAIAAISPANDDIVQRKSGAWTNRTMAQLATDLDAAGLIGDGLVTTRGDLIYRDATAPARLAVGAARQSLVSDGTDPMWRYPIAPNGLVAHQVNGSPMLASTFDPLIVKAASNLTDGTVFFAKIYLPYAATLTGVWWVPSATGNFTADNNNKVGLYTRSGATLTKVAESTNDGTTFKTTANTFSQKAFSSTYAAAAGEYYVALLRNHSAVTTDPAPYAINMSNAVFSTLGATANRGLCGTLAGQTDLPASTTMTSNAILHFCGVY
jgi:hypothetical protein